MGEWKKRLTLHLPLKLKPPHETKIQSSDRFRSITRLKSATAIANAHPEGRELQLDNVSDSLRSAFVD